MRVEIDQLLEHGPSIPPYVQVEPGQRKAWLVVSWLTRRFTGGRTDQTRGDPTRWRTFVLRTYGLDVEPNRAMCPRTAEAIDQVPGVVTAMISVLEPDVRLPSHVGLFLGAVRLHLGIRIPPGDTALSVGGVERHWQEGQAFLFEHSRWHTAWNHTGQPRVVLILDIERPMPWRWLARLNHRLTLALARSGRTAELVAHIEQLNGITPTDHPESDGQPTVA